MPTEGDSIPGIIVSSNVMESVPCTLIENVVLKEKVLSSTALKMYKEKGEHAVHNIED